MPTTEVQNNFSQFKINTAVQKPAETKAQQQTTPPAATEIKKDEFKKTNFGKIAGTIATPLALVGLCNIKSPEGFIKGSLSELKSLVTTKLGAIVLATTAFIGLGIGAITDRNINKGKRDKTTGQTTILGTATALTGGAVAGSLYKAVKTLVKYSMKGSFNLAQNSIHGRKFVLLLLKKLSKQAAIAAGVGATAMGVTYYGIKALLKNSANKTAETKSPDVKTTEAKAA